LIAVKSEVVKRFCAEMRRLGVTPQRVEAASILDYNAFRLNYPDVEEETLLINIGARSANLLFINADGFFVRNITLGGNTLTQNLADSLGKKFPEAERIKIAFFSGETSYDADDPSAKLLTTNAENFQKKVSQEITRSIVNYRRQKNGGAPKRILLTGRGSLLPGLSEQLEKTQRVPVNYFDPTAAIEVGPGLTQQELENHRNVLSEVVGEAARLVDPDAASINLLPQDLADKMRFAKQKPFILIGAACLALATVPPILHFSNVRSIYEDYTNDLQMRPGPLQATHAEILSLQEQALETQEDIADLEGLVNSRSNWISFFADLQERLQAVQDVWLEQLSLDRANTGNLMLSGRMLIKDWDTEDPDRSYQRAYGRVNALLEQFEASAFVEDVRNLRYDTSNPRILRFEFSLVINPQRPL